MAAELRELLVGDWWRYSISVIGTVILAVGAGSLLLDGQLTGDELRQGSALVVASLCLIGIGARIALVVQDGEQMALMLGWMSLGVLVLGVLGGWGAVVLPAVGSAFEVAYTFLSLLAIGALFGAVVGYYNVRVQGLARRAGRERARREALDEQQEILSSLTGILRHQILNDLSTISGRAQLLEAGKIGTEAGTEPILDHCEHMERTVDRVETLVGIHTHGSAPCETDLDASLQRAREITEESFPEFRADFEGIDGLAVRADEQLHLAFVELFENSVIHGNGTVTVTATERSGKVVVEVSDDGPGVDISRGDLFEPNSRGLDSDGDGLGLYFVSLIVRRYEGQLSLEETDSGATFCLELPIVSTAGVGEATRNRGE
ncbi:MAG: sensor histidine kinase [Halovenus sp.]